MCAALRLAAWSGVLRRRSSRTLARRRAHATRQRVTCIHLLATSYKNDYISVTPWKVEVHVVVEKKRVYVIIYHRHLTV